ncbi:unnamed protein product [Adineta ricciae]|uniref:Reverse transcriptase domain-containing protein n=1 Tax=Adineta ricciae TaxID=249248 RepID=A0A815ME89_ADIRI|nr:unnamed protein product [Adineta ricciae]CAF1533911.1 unnamed protein product [Adineta ricciae]
MVEEWHGAGSISSCLHQWSTFGKQLGPMHYSGLQVLYFNVQGVKTRWNEVTALTLKYQFDIMILGEVGSVDFAVLEATFISFQSCYQAGENSHDGVLILIRNGLSFSRIKCTTPNVIAIDIHLENDLRIVGLYAPASKTWDWEDLTPQITPRSVIFGDFNVDFDQDKNKAGDLLKWADQVGLAPYVTDACTSRRSKRKIDYAFSSGIQVTVDTYEGSTRSDHKPVIGFISCEYNETEYVSKTSWKAFDMFLSYAYGLWELYWSTNDMNDTYDAFIQWLVAVKARCSKSILKKKARLSIPKDIQELLMQGRDLACKASRKGCIYLREEARRLRSLARSKLKTFRQDQLTKHLDNRHKPGNGSLLYWNHVKKHFRVGSARLRGFTRSDGEVTKDSEVMVEAAADFYEKLFGEPAVMRPHPYVDTEIPVFTNQHEPIPPVTYPEILKSLSGRLKKRSIDAHGISPILIGHIPNTYWHLMSKLYNYSFATCFMPSRFKDVRIILLAKKDAICTPDLTRPIALLDSFLKVQERLFLNRFRSVLKDLGILPDSQSGFRPGHRLQTRVLLLIEQISSYMSNSSPVATVFVDFKSAFDQIWFEGCIGKLRRMGIPLAYVNWIQAWLLGRRCTIEINGKRSRWFSVMRGGPQGSCFTPTLFITYHADMGDFLPSTLSFFFADDLAAVLAGQMGVRYTDQCMDLERRLSILFEYLEYYSILSVQPINYSKTQAMWSARAVAYPDPMPRLGCGGQEILWVNSYKYLGYLITTKLGWGKIINRTFMKIRQQAAIINSIKFNGATSRGLRRSLFSTFIIPFFTWVYALHPLFTDHQRSRINRFYYTVLKRTLRCLQWNNHLFAYAFDERSFDDNCYAYWMKYLKVLSHSLDGFLLIEQMYLNEHRLAWRDGNRPIRCLRRSVRFVQHIDVFSRAMEWISNHGTADSIAIFDNEDIICLAEFPESF